MVRMSLVLRFKSARSLWRPFKLDTIIKPSTPGLNCPPKLWWAKEITQDIHISGRLTGRQLKYAAEGGFKSVVCLNMDDHGTFSEETLPSPSDIASISALTGMQTKCIQANTGSSNVPNLQAVREFSKIFSQLETPIILTGNTQRNAALLALLYLADQSKTNRENGLKVTSRNVYSLAASMGFDITDDVTKGIVSEVTGDDVIQSPIKPDLEQTPVSDYWPAHRIAKNWYTAGQIRRRDLPVLESAGFKSLINMRMGVEYADNPSQEPVTLLNVMDTLGTYDVDKRPTRKNSNVLEKNRVFPNIVPEYVNERSAVNYETINAEEFGDDVGYNEDIERDYVNKHSGLKYVHMPMPLPKDSYNRDMFEEFKDELVTADKEGPVLLHCRIGKRVAYFGILALAIKEGHTLQWAQKRSIEMGHEVSPEARPDVYKIYTEYLKSE